MEATTVVNARTVVIHARQRLARALVHFRCTALTVLVGAATAIRRKLFGKILPLCGGTGV
jgi:hypothetical protein